ncbi:class I SAM-dependent RNA methyltransferase [Demequina zhanjiangensis]|uniref:Class I SAM-dependent RNA methyltransferase n=1 Tax=Demequina zhanjiangensis TaxID=3051659 RepID=A0ABT8G0Q7_9MICO|nr:TRAM domain-containing protein [Demequina sp. SYSU T00b26]MDN4472726.1 class I SAM-dependent RNA methyltransferase [Demequina sp. SYSU T00b26]
MTTRIQVEVGKPAHGGHCVARHEGRAVFVRDALPGEVVVAEVVQDDADARFWRAETVEVLEASPDRVAHPWSDAGAGGVGGAELGHVALPAQRRWKQAVLEESFERFAGIPFEGTVHAAPGDDAREGLAYRTRVSAVAGGDGRPTMTVPGTGERRTLTSMPLATPEAEAALMGATADPGTRIDVTATSTGEVVVTTTGREARRLWLNERVEHSAGELGYRVRAADFWQVHREAPRVLVDAVMSRVLEDGPVLDLYSGAGLLALPLAAQGRPVVAVEAADGGKAPAALAANLRSRPGAEAVGDDVRRFLVSAAPERDWTQASVVLDPPRSGAKARNIAALAALGAPRIVYVACDPVALARDTALLRESGYDLLEADAFDLFPMTHHIETVASFALR